MLEKNCTTIRGVPVSQSDTEGRDISGKNNNDAAWKVPMGSGVWRSEVEAGAVGQIPEVQKSKAVSTT